MNDVVERRTPYASCPLHSGCCCCCRHRKSSFLLSFALGVCVCSVDSSAHAFTPLTVTRCATNILHTNGVGTPPPLLLRKSACTRVFVHVASVCMCVLLPFAVCRLPFVDTQITCMEINNYRSSTANT